MLDKAIIIALITAGATIIAAGMKLGLDFYKEFINDKEIKYGYTEKLTFNKAEGNACGTFKIKSNTGTMHLAMMQRRGKVKAFYNVKWRPGNKPTYTNVGTYKLKKNHVQVHKKLGQVKRKHVYLVCITKKKHNNRVSKIDACDCSACFWNQDCRY